MLTKNTHVDTQRDIRRYGLHEPFALMSNVMARDLDRQRHSFFPFAKDCFIDRSTGQEKIILFSVLHQEIPFPLKIKCKPAWKTEHQIIAEAFPLPGSVSFYHRLRTCCFLLDVKQRRDSDFIRCNDLMDILKTERRKRWRRRRVS